ncbi:MAG: hypothetical protein PHV34_02210 [Verrucomicrobiae bacterium]|nr:hypothetical protein [Verrucomicrobiae bacterium]
MHPTYLPSGNRLRQSRRWFGWFLLLLALGSLKAEDKRFKAEIYPLGMSDFELAVTIAKSIVTDEGKLVVDRENYRLIVYERIEKHDALREALKHANTPLYHVRIQVTLDDRQKSAETNLGFKPDAQSHPTGAPQAQMRIGGGLSMQNAGHLLETLTQQELVILSGGKGRLRIGKDIPYLDWFWNFGLQQGCWSGIMRWKEVGAQMAIEPHVTGKRVRLRITPEFSYVLDEKRLVTAMEKLNTEVIVNDGETIDLGGLPFSNQEFSSRFLFGLKKAGEQRSSRILLKLGIENVE